MDISDLSEKVIVITGAGSGVGRDIATNLMELGASLVLCDINAEALKSTCDRVKESKSKVLQVLVDIAQEDQVMKIFNEADSHFGRLDVVINCAAIWDDGKIEAISSERLDRVLSINLKGTFWMCQGAFSLMRKYAAGGSIVNIASVAAETGSVQAASHYAASKGAVIALSKSLAREGAPSQIRVNVVSPGPLDTPMTNITTENQRVAFGARTLLGRVGTPEDIGNAVLFLASSCSSWITGEVLRVNGGSLI